MMNLLFFSKREGKENLLDRLQNVVSKPFARITYHQAIQLLKSSSKEFQIPVDWNEGLASEHELFLAEEVFQGPVFVTHYPQKLKPFYMRASEDCKAGEETVACMDLLVPQIAELAGGSEREERVKDLEANLKRKKMKKSDYQWYIDLRRYGTVPHGGFGLGFERLLQFLTGVENVRDVCLVPRAPGNIQI